MSKKKREKTKKTISRSSIPNVQYIKRPAISEIDTPPAGFRAVSIAQAMIEYATPIMDFVEKGVVKDLNEALQLTMPLWNYNLSQKHRDFNKKDIIKQIGKVLKLNAQDSIEFFDMMIQRKEYLFPDEIQPDSPMTMFVRQEKRYFIHEFNYNLLNLSEKSYPPDDEDEKLVQLINQMDKYIAEGFEYDEWENHYFSMEEKCKEEFEKWLKFKGVKEYSEDFPSHIEIYLNFIYCYMHEDDINLKTVLPIYIDEFFVDYLLRKVIVEPQEYVEWPAAIKLFYNFLYEIGYLENPEKITALLNKIEPLFIEILRDRYS